jgi:hypothetical protein
MPTTQLEDSAVEFSKDGKSVSVKSRGSNKMCVIPEFVSSFPIEVYGEKEEFTVRLSHAMRWRVGIVHPVSDETIAVINDSGTIVLQTTTVAGRRITENRHTYGKEYWKYETDPITISLKADVPARTVQITVNGVVVLTPTMCSLAFGDCVYSVWFRPRDLYLDQYSLTGTVTILS